MLPAVSYWIAAVICISDPIQSTNSFETMAYVTDIKEIEA